MVENMIIKDENLKVPISLSSEMIAYWYLRINGFLTVTNFVVHPDMGSNQRTDVDILAARFPYRSELLINPMKDDIKLIPSDGKITIVLVEVKKGLCNLNGPWTDPKKYNMDRVMKAIGAFSDNEYEISALSLYERGFYINDLYHITLLCIGTHKNKELAQDYPEVKQILYDDIFRFIYKRFKKYRQQKASHEQWDDIGKSLWDVHLSCNNPDNFANSFQVK
jgi:hypothetical protein